MVSPAAREPTPEEVAAYLIEMLESMYGSGLRPVDPDRAALRARHPLPRTLVELWDYCGGETTNALFTLAHTVLPGFPHRAGTTMRFLSEMYLSNPGTVLWNEQNCRPRFLTRPGWVELATDPYCDSLYVDPTGVCWLRSKMVDDKNRRVHQSFDTWMAETALALRTGMVRIAPPEQDGDEWLGERIICGDLVYDLAGANTGSHWWDSKRKRDA